MAGDTGAPGFIPLYDDNSSFAPIQDPFNGISQALNTALKTFQKAFVSRVADQAARDALFTAPIQGDRVYRRDLGFQQVYKEAFNATTNPAGSAVPGWKTEASGLVPVIPTTVAGGTLGSRGLVTFSAATAVNINGCFSSDFTNYSIVIDVTASATTSSVVLRLRGAGVDDASATYDGQSQLASTNTVQAFPNVGGTSWSLTNAASLHAIEARIFGPSAARPTKILASLVDWSGVGGPGLIFVGGGHRASTSFDGLSIISTGGSMTGTARILGYNDN